MRQSTSLLSRVVAHRERHPIARRITIYFMRQIFFPTPYLGHEISLLSGRWRDSSLFIIYYYYYHTAPTDYFCCYFLFRLSPSCHVLCSAIINTT